MQTITHDTLALPGIAAEAGRAAAGVGAVGLSICIPVYNEERAVGKTSSAAWRSATRCAGPAWTVSR